ncbi:hypothetical protein [Devosia sp.]|uniref:hypothetical protein n=1 Tax=Devosia sp. TaxID=1871048 RepID=UPI0035B19729
MPKYLLAYHGGGMPATPEEGERVMKAWNDWYGLLGPAIADGGAPTGRARTVAASGAVAEGGGGNPITGYTVIEAANLERATELATGCPIRAAGGSIEVCECIQM